MNNNLNFNGCNGNAAGCKGFVEVRNGHFYVGEERIRFFGTNVVRGSCFPDKDLAGEIAGHLKRHGFNAVRLHHMDWFSDVGIFKDYSKDTIELDETKLDRLDYLVYLLENNGIYINFNTHVSRQFAIGDDMPEYDKMPFADKFINCIDDRAKQLHKDFIKRLLNRKNQYTGKFYRDDPGICAIEITNENWIYFGWMSGFLHESPNQDENNFARSIPPYYLDKLDRKWNLWLRRTYKTTENLLAKWKTTDSDVFTKDGEYKGLGEIQTIEKGNIKRLHWDNRNNYPHPVLEDNSKFLNEIERDYFVEMMDYIKIELNFQVPVTTTSGYFANPTLYSQTIGDFTDTHFYVDNMGATDADFGMKNISLIRDNASNEGIQTAGMYNFIASCALSKVKDMPMSISEYNVSFPSKYEYEILPVLVSYALYQDWDALYQYSYGHDLLMENFTKEQPLLSSLDIFNNSMKLAQSAVFSQMFIRGDVIPTRNVITAKYNNDEMYTLLNDGNPWSYNRCWEWNFDLKGVYPFVSIYKYRFEREYNQKETSVPSELFTTEEYEGFFAKKEHLSDENQLQWYGYEDKNYLVIDTKLTQGAVGFLKNKEIQTSEASIKLDCDSCVVFTSNDNSPLSESRDITICIAAGQYNNGQKLNSEGGFNVGDWGTAPLMQFKTNGTLGLKSRIDSIPRAYSVDKNGNMVKEIEFVKTPNQEICLKIDDLDCNIIRMLF